VHPQFLSKIPIFNVWESLKNFGLSLTVAVAQLVSVFVGRLRKGPDGTLAQT